MSDVLTEIIRGVKEDEQSRKLDRRLLAERIAAAPKPIDALGSLRSRKFSVISEVKRSSPSKGDLAEIKSPDTLAEIYAENGAGAISVLTEGRRFKGTLDDLAKVRQRVELPILRKDFMVSEYLVMESRAWGADIVLLIVAALDEIQLRDFYQLARELEMSVLVEIHDEAELDSAMAIEPMMIGVNARNLKNLQVNPEVFQKLIHKIPSHIYRVAESGIASPSDANAAYLSGADAVLVGESLVRSADPGKSLRELLAVADGSAAIDD